MVDDARVAAGAQVHPSAVLGAGSRIWELAQIREDAVVGPSCIIGRGAYIDAGVHIGARCKIQNYALVYSPCVLEDGVFVGPAAVLTNDRFPRAIAPDGRQKDASEWTAEQIHVGEGAAIGAQAVVVAGTRLGRWSMVGAGAVVTSDVPSFALVVGVPARRIGWLGRAGFPLQREDGPIWRCPRTGERYREVGVGLQEAGMG